MEAIAANIKGQAATLTWLPIPLCGNYFFRGPKVHKAHNFMVAPG